MVSYFSSKPNKQIAMWLSVSYYPGGIVTRTTVYYDEFYYVQLETIGGKCVVKW